MPKAKDGSECFTKTNKSGGKYVTCKGTQGKSKAPVKATDKQKELMRKRRAEAKAKKLLREVPLEFKNQSQSMKGMRNILTGFHKDKITAQARKKIEKLIETSKPYTDKQPYLYNFGGVDTDGNIEYRVLNTQTNKYEIKSMNLGKKAGQTKN